METVDCVVIGAGVVGLAVARALALSGREVIILETAEGIGNGTSSRNSEVIHAGIYYPKGSLMARTCVQGRRMLYAYCAEHGVPHRNCGKLIVATNAQESDLLQSIKGRAEANGVEGMRFLTAAEAMTMEPNLQCTAALLSPATGIVDSHSYMLALQGDAEAKGAMLAVLSPVERAAHERAVALVTCGSIPSPAGIRYPSGDRCLSMQVAREFVMQQAMPGPLRKAHDPDGADPSEPPDSPSWPVAPDERAPVPHSPDGGSYRRLVGPFRG